MILLGGTERLKKFLRESISEEFNNVQQNAVEFVHLGMVGRDSGSHMFQMFSKSELYHCIHLLQRPEAIPWWKPFLGGSPTVQEDMDPIVALLETHDFISYQEKGRSVWRWQWRLIFSRHMGGS